jgi:hypothetical protein
MVGDRADIGFPEAIITAVGSQSITLSENAYYSRSQDYRPLSQDEKIEVTSFYDPSHANLDGYQQLIPQNTLWRVIHSPFTNNESSYMFVKGGYLHPKTFGQSLQSVWKNVGQENGDASSYSAGPGEGKGGSRNFTGGDVAGKIIINTGTGTTANAIIGTLSFTNKFGTAPFLVLTPGNANAAALSGGSAIYVSATVSNFTLNSGTVALAASTQYVWYYHVMN